MANEEDNEKSPILSVAKFFGSEGDKYKSLEKPQYQRPYEWEPKHVETLLNDLLEFKREVATHYRLGCIILHDNKDNESLDVIDGQQRLVTLELIREVLGVSSGGNKVDNAIKGTPKEDREKPSADGTMKPSEGFYSSKEDRDKAEKNKKSIEKWFETHREEEDWIRQLVSDEESQNAIEIVVLVVGELDEAFQLFDTQNTRGKSLEVPDYLKAYHINCMSSDERKKALSYGLFDIWKVEDDTKKIKATLDNLFKIEEWSCRRIGEELEPKNMSHFYGFKEAKYEYQKHIFSQKDFYEIGRSFKAGEDFFWMIKYFRNLENEIVKEFIENEPKYPELPKYPKFLEEFVKEENKEKKWTEGIDTVASMRYCGLLFLRTAILYSSRFGYDSLLENNKKNAKILLAWSSLLRYVYDSLRFPAIENLAIGETCRVKPSLPMFMSMSHATNLDFLVKMREDVLKHNSKGDNLHKDKKEGYQRLKKALASLAGINDEEKNNESPDTTNNG